MTTNSVQVSMKATEIEMLEKSQLMKVVQNLQIENAALVKLLSQHTTGIRKSSKFANVY